jgi:hypothetical protein
LPHTGRTEVLWPQRGCRGLHLHSGAFLTAAAHRRTYSLGYGIGSRPGARAPARSDGEYRPGNKTRVQERGERKNSPEEEYEPVVLGSLGSLRPLKEEIPASVANGFFRPRTQEVGSYYGTRTGSSGYNEQEAEIQECYGEEKGKNSSRGKVHRPTAGAEARRSFYKAGGPKGQAAAIPGTRDREAGPPRAIGCYG